MNKKIIALAGIVLIGVIAYYLVLSFPSRKPHMDSADVIAFLQKEIPELSQYSTDTLPPKRIEAKETDSGWLIGFYMEGSGVKGILDAKCYAVSKEGRIEQTGSYRANNTPPVEKIELSNCRPVPASPIQASTGPLLAKKWTWKYSLYNDGRQITPKQDVFTLTLSDDGTFSITTDCNSGGGKYVKMETAITFSDIVRTEMACGGSQEDEFVTMIQNISGYLFGPNGELVFDLKFDSGSVVFR